MQCLLVLPVKKLFKTQHGHGVALSFNGLIKQQKENS